MSSWPLAFSIVPHAPSCCDVVQQDPLPQSGAWYGFSNTRASQQVSSAQTVLALETAIQRCQRDRMASVCPMGFLPGQLVPRASLAKMSMPGRAVSRCYPLVVWDMQPGNAG
eukprot:5393415-Amphidinium_carterae.1